MKKKIINGVGIGLIAGLIVLLDAIFCSYFFEGNLFIWIAFASWTIFFTAKTKERISAIPGYFIGIFCAIGIIYLGNLIYEYIPLSINNQSMTSFIATSLIVSILMVCYEFKLLNFTSISSVFIGIWLIFSGLGANMYPNSLQETLIIIFIISLYSLVGLLAGALSMSLYKMTSKFLDKK